MAYKRNPVGRPPKYKSVEEIQGKIDAYFTACKGHPLMNPDTGEPFQDKYGLPIIVDARRAGSLRLSGQHHIWPPEVRGAGG